MRNIRHFARSSWCGLAVALLSQPAFLESAASAPSEPSDGSRTPKSQATIHVDKEKGEVSFPCRFVNPTRLLEVFACHRTGPTHETVVEFDVTGEDIYEALLSAGLRNASYWNGTSPEDFVKNQGDRVLVLIRWEDGGERHEVPAEGMLLEGSTGFPSFLRGFSFSARTPEAARKEEGTEAGAPEEPAAQPRIPDAVEITLGATNRQSAVYSLLTHPTNLPRVRDWMLPPQLDTNVVKGHADLVEKRAPATLIIRRVASEVALLEQGRARDRERGLTDRLPLHDQLLPMAVEIDELKKRYEGLLERIRSFLGKESSGESAGDEAERGLALIKEGRWICARVEELYLSRYAKEEAFKAAWVEARKDLPVDVREDVSVYARDGIAFEPRLTAKEVEMARLLMDGEKPGGGRLLLKQKEIEAIQIERDLALARANLRYVERRLAELDESDPYTKKLFFEDKAKFEILIRACNARLRIAQTEATEIAAAAEGTWEGIRTETLAARRKAEAEVKITELEDELLKTRAQIRWTEMDLESKVPEREKDAKEALSGYRKVAKELEVKIEEARKALETGSAPEPSPPR